MINPIHITHSPTYPSVETDDMYRFWQWQWQYCWGKLLLCFPLGTCLRTLIRRLNVSLYITDSKLSNRVLECMAPKSGSINRVTKWLDSCIFASIGAKDNFLTSILPTAFCLLNCFLISLSSLQSAVC